MNHGMSWRFPHLAALAFVLLCHAGAVVAQGALDARTFDQLSKAQELATEDRFEEAIYILDRLRDRGQLNSYGRSQLWNFYAFIYAKQESYEQAITAYRKVLTEEDAPEGLLLTAKYTIGQLYFQMESYAECIQFIEDWLSTTTTPTPLAHVMLAQAYYQLQNLPRALENINTAVDLEQTGGKTPQESWLRLKAVLHYADKDFEQTADTYERLVSAYPSAAYLKQLAGVYSELGDDDRRLAVFDAVHEWGALESETELLNLAYMWLGSSVPYKAGRIIESAMEAGRVEGSTKNLETLANAWAQANEYDKAVPTLTRMAELTGEGIYYARLAGVHFNAGQYAAAAEAAARADSLGGLKSPAGNRMLLGMAHFNLNQYEPALQAFRQAKRDSDTFDAARKWESYTLNEINRIRAIAKAREELEQRTRDALEAQENNVQAIGLNPS